MARFNPSDRSEFYFKQGSCRITLKFGDLLKETDVDAIVVPIPSFDEAEPDTFAIFKSICNQAGRDFKESIQRVRSETERLKPKMILGEGRQYIFAVPPYLQNLNRARDLLQKTYTSCLELAIKNNFQTIAFPTIGCGVIGFDINDVTSIIYHALEKFEQSKTKMNEIRIVIYDGGIWDEFTRVFMNKSLEKNAKIKFEDTSTKSPNSTDMSSTRDRRTTTQQPQRQNPNNIRDIDDETVEHQRDDARRRISNKPKDLNPECPAFNPTNKNKSRIPRHYRINNNKTELIILQGDIIKTKVDAIVNAANECMLGGGGVDGIVHKAAGRALMDACRAHKKIYSDVRLPVGRSRILLSYDMSKTTSYIINTSGPRYDDAQPDQSKKDLISCYKTSLALANLYDLETIGFTAISCGIFGYPVGEGAEVALETVDQEAGEMRQIYFVLWDDDIYDAWVKKAKQLKFVSMNDDDDAAAATTSTSKKSTDNKKNSTQNTSSNDDQNSSDAELARKVIDGSTSGVDEPRNVDRKNSHEGSPPPSNDQSNNQRDVVDNEDGNTVKETTESENTKSEGKKSDDETDTETPDKTVEQKQARNKTETPTSQTASNATNKSIVKGPRGRGK